jgi:hypothetical protein
LQNETKEMKLKENLSGEKALDGDGGAELQVLCGLTISK